MNMCFRLICWFILILVLFRVLMVSVLLRVNFMLLVLEVLSLVVEICLERFVVGMIVLVRLMLQLGRNISLSRLCMVGLLLMVWVMLLVSLMISLVWWQLVVVLLVKIFICGMWLVVGLLWIFWYSVMVCSRLSNCCLYLWICLICILNSVFGLIVMLRLFSIRCVRVVLFCWCCLVKCVCSLVFLMCFSRFGRCCFGVFSRLVLRVFISSLVNFGLVWNSQWWNDMLLVLLLMCCGQR